MSLDVDISKVANRETVCFEPDPDRPGESQWRLVSLSIAAATMYVGLFEITADNVDRWWARVSMCQRLAGGPVFRMWWTAMPAVEITREDIGAHIGLHTNAFPTKSDAEFLPWAWRLWTEDVLSLKLPDDEPTVECPRCKETIRARDAVRIRNWRDNILRVCEDCAEDD